MSKCQVLSKLAKAKKGALSVTFRHCKIASTTTALRRIDVGHPACAKGSRLKTVAGDNYWQWSASPLATLSLPDPAVTFESPFESWQGRLKRGAEQGVLPPPGSNLADPRKLEVALYFHMAKKTFHAKRYVRATLSSRVRNAIDLIVRRGADMDKDGNLILDERDDPTTLRRLFYPGWAYRCVPTVQVLSLTKPQLVSKLRGVFEKLSASIIIRETEWAKRAKRKLVLPSADLPVVTTLVKAQPNRRSYAEYKTRMKAMLLHEPVENPTTHKIKRRPNAVLATISEVLQAGPLRPANLIEPRQKPMEDSEFGNDLFLPTSDFDSQELLNSVLSSLKAKAITPSGGHDFEANSFKNVEDQPMQDSISLDWLKDKPINPSSRTTFASSISGEERARNRLQSVRKRVFKPCSHQTPKSS